jgi:hypothetical protein
MQVPLFLIGGVVIMSKGIQSDIYEAYMGLGPKRVPHWEHWSNPDAETYLTRIDYYDHPRLCRVKMNELFPQLRLDIPKSDEPLPRPSGDRPNEHTVRWGAGQTGTYLHGERFFKTEEDVFAFSPLEHADMREWVFVVENWDYTGEDAIEARFASEMGPKPWATPQAPSIASVGFYNTTFMWPMLTFGWEMFLATCLDPRFERVMDEFAELNRRVFRVFARLPVKFAVCHDDIVTTRGPVCSPEWMRKYVFARYEEYWSMMKAAGKEVIFMSDGCVDRYVDDIMACGARGIISEPYTDYKAIARKYRNPFIAGEGDNRVLMRNNPDEIRAMVLSMAETARMSGGYMMCIGNHIPWNVPGDAIKRYLDLSQELTAG